MQLSQIRHKAGDIWYLWTAPDPTDGPPLPNWMDIKWPLPVRKVLKKTPVVLIDKVHRVFVCVPIRVVGGYKHQGC